MKSVLIIGSTDSGSKNDPAIVASHLVKKGIKVKLGYWEEVFFSIKTGDVRVTVDNEDIVSDIKPDVVLALNWYKSGNKSYYRDLAYALALYLDHSGVPFWNSEMKKQRSTTKLSCMVQLALGGIPVPRTLFSLQSNYTFPGLPFIVKAIAASRGRSNHLVHSNDDAIRYLSEGVPCMVQPFLPNNHDLRIICFDGRPAMVLRRSRGDSSDTHMNNTTQGGEGQWVDLSEIDRELLTLSSKICIILGREMGGIDFIPDSSSPFGYSCLEVNAIPQLTSGYDVARKLDGLAATINEIESEYK